MHFTNVLAVAALVVIVHGQEHQQENAIEKMVSDQEILFPASLLDGAQLQSIEAQLPQAILPITAGTSKKTDIDDAEDEDQAEDDGEDDTEQDETDEEIAEDEGEDDEQDWVDAAADADSEAEADKPVLTKDFQKQNHILTTSWSVSGSSSYPIVIDTDFVFSPITLAPESSRTGAAPAATATPAVRNKKKVKQAQSAASSNTSPSWSITSTLLFLGTSLLVKLIVN